MKYKGEVHLGTTRYITLVTSFFFLECFKLQKKFHCFPGVQKSCHYFQPSLNTKILYQLPAGCVHTSSQN
jgi:hypothetical protein